MKKLMKEFKEFALKGNMVDLAVGMIIGSAFSGIVSSLVSDIVMPLLSLLTGKIDFTNKFLALDGEVYKTLAQAQEAGAPTVNYGLFLTELLNFLIMAFVIFLVVKQLNRLHRKPEAPEAVTEKECPYCKTMIPLQATRCPHCTSKIETESHD